MLSWDDQARVELQLRTRGLRTIWKPNPGPQEAVLSSAAYEVLFGGAAGGGKTSVLVNLARQFHSALLIRRTFPQLEDSLVLESKKWYGDPRRYNSSKHVWTLADGRRVRMGHLERDDDKYNYQGAEFDFLGIDELTQLSEAPYEYLLSRIRTTRRGHACRVVCTSNPGGTGHAWVKTRWAPWLDDRNANPAKPGEIRYFIRDANGNQVETTADDPDAISRTFIPARLADNPHLDEGYRKRLSLMPEPYRSQLLHGDWSAGEEDDAYQVVPTSWVRAAMARWTPEHGNLDALGVDVAHGGKDRTVLAYRSGAKVFRIDTHPGSTTPDGQSVVAILGTALAAGGWAYIDAMPPSAYDIARGLRMRVIGVNFGGGSEKTDKSCQFKFANMRAEVYWRARELLSPEAALPVSLPPDTGLLQELTEPRWSVQLSGITIEKKDAVAARLGRSPDLADAVALCLWGGSSAGPMIFVSGGRRDTVRMGGMM